MVVCLERGLRVVEVVLVAEDAWISAAHLEDNQQVQLDREDSTCTLIDWAFRVLPFRSSRVHRYSFGRNERPQ